MSDPVLTKIRNLIKDNEVVLFMKGNKLFPQCGFSAVVAEMLNSHSIDFLDVDVLQDMSIRQGIKDFSNWPTIPQLYVKEKFIGGCDVVKKLQEQGNFAKIFI